MVESAERNRILQETAERGAGAAAGPAPDEAVAEEIFESAARKLAAARVPIATYRVQLNGAFTFADATSKIDYLAQLGVSDLYASPFFKARPGSTHGYDLIDHNAIHAPIGTRDDFDRLTDDLSERGMGLLLDFVPNHMGIGSGNAWWMDVLENGPSSLFAPFFDIDWAPLKSELRSKVLLPILGDHYGRVLENGDLRVDYAEGAFFVRYYDVTLPVNPRTYAVVLEPMLPSLIAKLAEEHDAVLELQSILTGLTHLPTRFETHRSKVIERRREKEILKRRLAAAIADTPEMAAALATSIDRVNGRKGDPKSFDALHAMLEEQAYRLSFWRVAAEEINYRRFFDVNELAAIRMEKPVVFANAHRMVLALIGEGRVTGLRIDHPDGLWDPLGYFASVQRAVFLERCRVFIEKQREGAAPGAAPPSFERQKPALESLFDRALERDPEARGGRPLYIVAEKILARGETLPEDWPIYGTSGYEFAVSVAGIFIDPSSERAMTELYERFTGLRIDFESLVYQKKKLILLTAMASELAVLAHALNRISERDRHSRDFTLGSLTDALREVIACFPIYRTYVTEAATTISEHDRIAVSRAIRLARRRNPTTDPSIYAFLRAILMLDVPESVPAEDRSLWREFVMKFQQLTGPVMAKGLEDTAFYNYNRLVSLNEVGGEPERYGSSVAAFHRANAQRQRSWPSSMLTTSTHDTKRSEDVRARISVLSELPSEWEASVTGLAAAAATLKTELEERLAPDANEEYLLYQTIVGTYPVDEEGKGPSAGADDGRKEDPQARGEYAERIVAYMRKATKEAKVNTSWIDANPEYDAAVEAFVRRVLAPDGPAHEHLGLIARAVAYHGMWSSLSQALLKLMSPGVPDIYQGTEMWDDSLVDPDNRRPVDYATRMEALAAIRAREGEGAGLAEELVATARDGRIKLFVTHVALRARHRLPEVFGAQGSYVPLDAIGSPADHVVAFCRRAGSREIVVIVPRLTAKLCGGRTEPPLGALWSDTRLPIAEGKLTNLFTSEEFVSEDRGEGSALALDQVFARFPVALLERGARS